MSEKNYTHDLYDLEGVFVQNFDHDMSTESILMAVERFDGVIGKRIFVRGERLTTMRGTCGFRCHQQGPVEWSDQRMPNIAAEIQKAVDA